VPLTPTDVANKQFKIAFRGYALEEVDAFLDEVESELGRLLRDNNDLRTKASDAPPAPAAPAVTAPRVPQPEPEPVKPAAAPVAELGGQEAALRTLLLAQRTADEAVAEARAEAEQIVSAARAEADQTLTSAREEAETTLSSARRESEQMLTASRAEVDSTLTAARQKAASVDQEVAARIKAATGNLEERRAQLEHHIEELRAFEREYRTRLRAYLENQLRDLTGRSPSDDDAGAGVPAGARSSAVGLPPAGPAAAGEPAPPNQSGLRAVSTLGQGGDGVGPFVPGPSAGDPDATPR
jgi:DivIVA domain-containing protein